MIGNLSRASLVWLVATACSDGAATVTTAPGLGTDNVPGPGPMPGAAGPGRGGNGGPLGPEGEASGSGEPGSGTEANGSSSTSSGDLASNPGGLFDGAGTVAGVPLATGFGPETANDCPPAPGVSGTPTQLIRDDATLCFFGEDPTTPAATIEQVIESVDEGEYVHLRVTFNPSFVDNTYGAEAIGWGNSKRGTHTFKDLLGSDHVELLMTDCSGATVLQMKVDYVTADPAASSGYSSLGVTGGEGQMIVGDASAVLAVGSSVSRNLNGCGYAEYTTDSPRTDESYTPNPDAPEWDFRVVYDVWLDPGAFQGCFGQAYIESVHASPSKGADNTQIVLPGPCPPDWDIPYCPPSVIEEGGNCAPPSDEPCPPNTTQVSSAECPAACVPVPFAGYEDRAACPAGYVIDIQSEGQYCLPEDGSCP